MLPRQSIAGDPPPAGRWARRSAALRDAGGPRPVNTHARGGNIYGINKITYYNVLQLIKEITDFYTGNSVLLQGNFFYSEKALLNQV